MQNQFLNATPDNADALHTLGLRAYQIGKNEMAADLLSRAVELKPGEPAFHNNLGNALKELGRLDSAIGCYEKAVAIKPDYQVAWYNLGLALQIARRPDAAIGCYEKAIDLSPECYEAYTNLGIALQSLGKLDDAILYFERSLKINPDYPLTYNNLGITLQNQWKLDAAVESYEKALKIKPDYYEAHNNLGYALQSQGKFDAAIREYEATLAIKPDYHKAYTNMGNCWKDLGRVDLAIGCYEKAMEIAPDDPVAHGNLLFTCHYTGTYDPHAIFEEHLSWARRHEGPLRKTIQPHRNDRTPNRRLRIGYVSPDFRTHSVAYFIEPVLASHDYSMFEVFCYDARNRPDEVTARLHGLADHWRSIAGLSDEDAAELVRSDSIDILIDLAGHTAENRLLLFARKPAPVQVTWLGYPDTTGLEAMDYRITDVNADPEGMTENLHSEELVRLPETFLCYRPPADAPEVGALPVLKSGGITFVSFNNFAKVSSSTIYIWSQVLKAVPNSVLVLKIKAAEEGAVQDSLFAAFKENGVSPDRVKLVKTVSSVAQHLEFYNHADIALDTFPYNGTTTTCEAMWMGVPVVTLAGNTHVARVGASILTSAGLSELIAQTPEEYVNIAASLANNIDRLISLRSEMRGRMERSALAEQKRFTCNLEEMFRTVWKKWCMSETETNNETLINKISSFPYWYHRIELPNGVVTPGWAPLNKESYGIPADLTGKRVLDVGSWDGFWTFEALKRGAREVVAIDDFSDFLGHLENSERKAWETFDLCKEALGYSDEVCRRIDMSVYDVSEELLGRFDVVFFFGTLYHLRHPLLALDRLSAVCDDEIYVETAILDDYSPYRGGLGHGYDGGQMVAEFYPDDQYSKNQTNWWVPTLHCLSHMVRSAGFARVDAWKLTKTTPANLSHCRGFAKGVKKLDG